MLRLRNGLRTDGRIDWEVLGVQVNRGEVTLYGEVQTNDQKGLDQSGDDAELVGLNRLQVETFTEAFAPRKTSIELEHYICHP
jgi:hypothetical protein